MKTKTKAQMYREERDALIRKAVKGMATAGEKRRLAKVVRFLRRVYN